MEPDLVIKYVNRTYGRYWSVDRSINCAAFSALLSPWLSKLKDPQYSRLRGPGKSPRALVNVLANPQVLKKIEDALACPGLFACKNDLEIDALIAPQVIARKPEPESMAPDNDSLIVPSADCVKDIPLSANEADMVAKVSAFILRQSKHSHLVCWPDPPTSGASFLAYVVAARDVSSVAGVNTYLAQPFPSACARYLQGSDVGAGEVPFERALHILARTLGLPVPASPQSLLDKLIETNSTLFVLHGECLQTQTRRDSSAMYRLLLEAKERYTPRNSSCTPIVVVGIPIDPKFARRTTRFNELAGRAIQFGPDSIQERSDFFERQWHRYGEVRGIRLDAEANSSRLKRVRHYYLSDAWPATIRLNAFFASNYNNFSYFDPTMGWTRMADMAVETLPIDVRLHLEEVVNRLLPMNDGKRRSALRATRWCSTAVYWLTSEAAENLGKKLVPRTKLDAFHVAVSSEDGLVEVVRRAEEQHTNRMDLTARAVVSSGEKLIEVDKRYVYKMDLAARAAIQDRWMRENPLDRANIHYHIALRLYRCKDDKELLGVEFPIEPHWGRSRLHFLVECLRHLIRTCDQSHQTDSPGTCQWEGEGSETFPMAPTSKTKSCNPHEVINFCFGQIYWRELNGNGRSTHQATRKLALQHGAYHLTAELLSLMSDGQQLGKPHWALNKKYVARYLREVGFSQLDMGDLQRAKATFESLIARALASNPQNPLDVIDYQLDLTVVLASMDDLHGAGTTLAEVRTKFESITVTERTGDARLTQQIQTRIRARQAHLAYLRGSFQEALEHCQHIEQNSPTALVRDVAHTYISTLGSLGDRRSLELAMKICVRQLFENTSRGLHHEALGFRVALGHCFRKLGLVEAAEATLDGAYQDILQYGCSERTYLAMLLEAGRILHHQGRFLRAYAAYLKPCLDRAQQRGCARTALHAHSYARECLNQLVKAVPGEGWSITQIATQLEGRGDYLQIKRCREIDPRYSYDPIAVERWLPRLKDRAALAQEMDALASSDETLGLLSANLQTHLDVSAQR